MYVKRAVEKILLELSKSFQVITIYGSRQVGKTTTVDHLFGNSFETDKMYILNDHAFVFPVSLLGI